MYSYLLYFFLINVGGGGVHENGIILHGFIDISIAKEHRINE